MEREEYHQMEIKSDQGEKGNTDEIEEIKIYSSNGEVSSEMIDKSLHLTRVWWEVSFIIK